MLLNNHSSNYHQGDFLRGVLTICIAEKLRSTDAVATGNIKANLKSTRQVAH